MRLQLLNAAGARLSHAAGMFVPCEGRAPPDFKGWTLLLPAVSVGNVGQLAVDLVISTLGMSKIGYFYTDCLVPMIGNNPYATTEENATELCINSEVYAAPSKKLVVLQIRSPFLKYGCSISGRIISSLTTTLSPMDAKNVEVSNAIHCMVSGSLYWPVLNKYRPFCQTLLLWVKSCGFAKTVVLSSSYAYQCNDQQLQGTSLRYLLSPAVEKTCGSVMEKLSGRELEHVAAFPGLNDDEKTYHIPGGGITKVLFNESCSKGIPLVVLLKFCSEGDNIPDALTLADYLNEWLQLTANQQQTGSCSLQSLRWKIPSSWKLLFGSGLPPALF